MTNKELYIILRRLGMVDRYDDACVCADTECVPTVEDTFQDETCKDIISITNFVDDLCMNNDINYIKKFLVCMFFENGGQEK